MRIYHKIGVQQFMPHDRIKKEPLEVVPESVWAAAGSGPSQYPHQAAASEFAGQPCHHTTKLQVRCHASMQGSILTVLYPDCDA